tara:strand:+ start:1449 stop:2423 length:975 start_codon:yes stop_codon:yes gene_type:complete
MFKCELCDNQEFTRKSHYLSHLKTRKHICNKLEKEKKELDVVFQKYDEKNSENPSENHIKKNAIPETKPIKSQKSTINDLGESSDSELNRLTYRVDKLADLYDLLLVNNHENDCKYEECIDNIKFLKKENRNLKSELLKLKNEIKSLKNNRVVAVQNMTNMTNTSNNINTVHNNNVNIHLNVCPFGRENWDYLSMDVVIPIMKKVNECIPEIIKLLHFDIRHPENHNLFIPNKRTNQVKVFNGTKWETKEKNVTIEELKNKVLERLETNYEGLFNKEASQFIQKLWVQLRDGSLDKSMQREIRNSIEYVILDNHVIVKNTNESS